MIYYVDIDNTICTTANSDYKNSIPIYDHINKINRLYDNNHTVIYWTARGSNSGIDWLHFTIDQLKSWGCKYTDIRVGKPNYDFWIDDKNINTQTFFDHDISQKLSKKNQFEYISSQLTESDKYNRKKLLIVMPASHGDIFLTTSLLQSLKHDLYPDYDIYFACKPQFQHILYNNQYIHKVIDYMPLMDSAIQMEGCGNWKGFFDICLNLNILTQMAPNYHRNANDKSLYLTKINKK